MNASMKKAVWLCCVYVAVMSYHLSGYCSGCSCSSGCCCCGSGCCCCSNGCCLFEVRWVKVILLPWFPSTSHNDRQTHTCIHRSYTTTQQTFGSPASVRLSVTLVDQDHTGWKSWKLIPRSISPPPLFVAQRPSTYSQGNMGKFGGD